MTQRLYVPDSRVNFRTRRLNSTCRSIERLEDRVLLTHDPEPFLTVIVHGQQRDGTAPDWAYAMGAAIATQFKAAQFDADGIGCDKPGITNGKCDSVFVLDWAAETTWILPGGVDALDGFEIAVNSVAAEITRRVRDLYNRTAKTVDLHLIGHSRGGSVVSEAVKRIGDYTANRLGYVQLTTLDTSPFGVPDPLPEKSDRVDFWDNYYQRVGIGERVRQQGLSNLRDPIYRRGESFLGAVNVDLTERLVMWNARQGEWAEHTEVHDWYHAFIEPNFASMNSKPSDLSRISTPGFFATEPGGLSFAEKARAHLPIAGIRKPWEPPQHNPGDQTLPSGFRDDFPNSLSNPKALDLGPDASATIPGNIEFVDDRDSFVVRTVRNGLLKVEVGTVGSGLDSYVTVFDVNANWLTADDNKGPGSDAQEFLNVVANQTYLIEVAGARGSIGSYHLLVSQPQTQPPPDPARPVTPPPERNFHDAAGESFSDAKLIGIDGVNKGDDSGRISPSDDIDTFKFVAQATGQVEIDVVPRGGLTTFATLYDGQNAVDSDTSEGDGASDFVYSVVAGQTYYVKIESKDRASTGEFELHVKEYDPSTAPGSSGTDGPPGPLPGWGRVRGVQINLQNGNGSSRGSIDSPADEIDWYQIDGAQAGNMQVVVASTNDDLTEFVTVFRSDGGPIDTDSGDNGPDAHVCFPVAAGERIIVAVTSHEGRSHGPYTVAINQPSTCPDDDLPDFGEQPSGLQQLTDEGNGFVRGRIEDENDNDWFQIPVRGAGYMTLEVDQSAGPLVGFLELNNTGDGGGWFNSDDGRDGRARMTFLPSAGMQTVWARVSSVDGTRGEYTLNVWRGPNPGDDFPDSGGIGVPDRALGNDGILTLSGRLEHPNDQDAFRIRATRPGPVAIQVISLTEGFVPFMERSRQHGDPNQWLGTDNGSGRGGRTFTLLPDVMGEPDNWINIDISNRGEANSPVRYGDYVLYVWEPQSGTDFDPQTVGIEASPILLDGRGDGSLPGQPNGAQPTPALDYAGDEDVFQFVAAADRELTVTASGVDTFVTLYDASGTAVASDHGSGPNGASQVTVDAFRGSRYYLRVKAFNGTDTGTYSVTVAQPADDHPDVAIFQPKGSQQRDATPLLSAPVAVIPGFSADNTVTALDLAGGKLYWLEVISYPSSRIRRAELDGTNFEDILLIDLIDSPVSSIAPDAVHGKLYWSDFDRSIHRANLDGSSPETLLAGLSGEPTDVVVDAIGGKLYWLEQADTPGWFGSTTDTIRRANLDGTGAENLITGDHTSFQVGDLALDTTNAKLYWSDYIYRGIRRADLDGSHIVDVATDLGSLWASGSLAVDPTGGWLYVSADSDLVRLRLDGSQREVLYRGIATRDLAVNPVTESLYWPAYVEVTPEVFGMSLFRGNTWGDATAGEISAVGDRDVFQYTAPGRELVTIDVVTTDNRLDTFVRVYDSRGNLVAIDDDGGDGRNSHVVFTTFMGETYFVEVAGYGDNSIGTYRIRTAVGPQPRPAFVMTDDFEDGQLDNARWESRYFLASEFETVAERDGVLRLLAKTGGSLHASWNFAYVFTRATVLTDVSFDFTATVPPIDQPWGFDLNYVRIELVNTDTWGPNIISWGGGPGLLMTSPDGGHIELTAYGDLLSTSGPLILAQGSRHRAQIENVGDEIIVLIDGTELARFLGPLPPNSVLFGEVQAAVEPSSSDPPHESILELDNVYGTFALPNDSVAVSYDTFDDQSFDTAKWHVAGTVEENGGVLKLPLFRNGQPVNGYVSTADMLGGMNLRGFKLGSNRTVEPKRLTGWDTIARMELTNGNDWIRISWDLKTNTFRIETGGAYGDYRTDIPVPDGQIPDGPLEIRERDGDIEVLHNGNVKLTLAGQTVRAGSYFTFETAGNPFGQSMNDPPANFDAQIDSLEFYVDRPASALAVTPSLQQASDSGLSDTDHVINHLNPTFEWTTGPEGATYQWREGELLEDGTVAYGPWSQPQAETNATVNLPHGSVHVFSVRPIGPDGIVGQESARGIVVDTAAPTIVDILVRGSSWAPSMPSYSVFPPPAIPLPWMSLDQISVRFSEDVSAVLSDMTLRGITRQEYEISGFAYDPSTFTATWTLAEPISADKLLIDMSMAGLSLQDVAGNIIELADPHYRFGVLPGDVDGSGRTLINDVILIRNALSSTLGDPVYTALLDLDGNGRVLINDVILARNHLSASLPDGEPEAAPLQYWALTSELASESAPPIDVPVIASPIVAVDSSDSSDVPMVASPIEVGDERNHPAASDSEAQLPAPIELHDVRPIVSTEPSELLSALVLPKPEEAGNNQNHTAAIQPEAQSTSGADLREVGAPQVETNVLSESASLSMVQNLAEEGIGPDRTGTNSEAEGRASGTSEVQTAGRPAALNEPKEPTHLPAAIDLPKPRRDEDGMEIGGSDAHPSPLVKASMAYQPAGRVEPLSSTRGSDRSSLVRATTFSFFVVPDPPVAAREPQHAMVHLKVEDLQPLIVQRKPVQTPIVDLQAAGPDVRLATAMKARDKLNPAFVDRLLASDWELIFVFED